MSDGADAKIGFTIRNAQGAASFIAVQAGNRRYVIGRKINSFPAQIDVALDDENVSRRHCLVAWDDAHQTWTLCDLGSTNGTWADGQDIGSTAVPIAPTASIRIGRTELTASLPAWLEPDGTVDDHEDATITAAPPPADDYDTDATMIGPDRTRITSRPAPLAAAMADTGDATVIAAAAPTDDGDATVLGDVTALADTTMLAPESTVLADATALADEADATQMAPPGAAESAEDDGDATTIGAAAPTDPDATALPTQTAPRRPAATAAPRPPEPANAPPELKERRYAFVRRLVDLNLLTPTKAKALIRDARQSGRTFMQMLAADTSIKYEKEVYKLAAEWGKAEFIDDLNLLIDRIRPLNWLPLDLANRRGVIPLASSDDKTQPFVLLDPFDVTITDWLARCGGRRVTKAVTPPSMFHTALQRVASQNSVSDADANVVVVDISPDEENRIATESENVDAPQLVNYILQRAFNQGSSDIHIEPTEDFLLIRNRVDGILHEDTALPMTIQPEVTSRVKILSGMDVAEKRRPQDGRIGTVIRGNPIDIRASSYPTIYGEKMVLRLLDKNALRPSPDQLGLLPADLQTMYEKLNAPFGLVMISGPTGSGKTTTLYSCLGAVDKTAKNVLTVEDPVEYRLKGVHQMQVNEKIGVTFAAGLRTILRQDPDVIMVGECRDPETAGMSIQAALTGHIVFSTIHTNDAVGVVARLLDMGIDRFLVANALSLAIAQRLVRVVCKHCGTLVAGSEVLRRLENDGVTADRLAALGITVDEDLAYVVGVGCVHCRNTGYAGRRAVFEVFEMTTKARAAILSPDFDSDALRRMARQNGMATLIDHGLSLVEEGITTHDEVIRVLGEAY